MIGKHVYWNTFILPCHPPCLVMWLFFLSSASYTLALIGLNCKYTPSSWGSPSRASLRIAIAESWMSLLLRFTTSSLLSPCKTGARSWASLSLILHLFRYSPVIDLLWLERTEHKTCMASRLNCEYDRSNVLRVVGVAVRACSVAVSVSAVAWHSRSVCSLFNVGTSVGRQCGSGWMVLLASASVSMHAHGVKMLLQQKEECSTTNRN